MGVCFLLVREVISEQQYLPERGAKLFPRSFYVVFTLMASSGSPSDEARHHGCPRHCGLFTLRAVCDFIYSVHVSQNPLSVTGFLSLRSV